MVESRRAARGLSWNGTDWRAFSTNKWMFPKIVVPPNKPSILIGFSIINHPFWCITILGNTQILMKSLCAKGIWFPRPLPTGSFAERMNLKGGSPGGSPCWLLGIILAAWSFWNSSLHSFYLFLLGWFFVVNDPSKSDEPVFWNARSIKKKYHQLTIERWPTGGFVLGDQRNYPPPPPRNKINMWAGIA